MSEELSLVLTVSFAAVWILCEKLKPANDQKFFRKGFFADLVYYTLAQSYVLGLIIFGFIHWLDNQQGVNRFEAVSNWPIILQFIFFFILHDLYIYAFHRLQHAVPFLWRFHEAHHSVENVDWLAGSRSHPVEILINQTVEFLPIILLGADPQVALWKGIVDAGWGMYIHSNIRIEHGILKYLFNGPHMHRWHHNISDMSAYGKNFGTKLSCWDYLFRTAYAPANQWPQRFGLESENFPDGYLSQVVYAFLPSSKRDQKLE